MKKNILTIAFIMIAAFAINLNAQEKGTLLADGFRKVQVEEFDFQWKINGNNIDVRLTAPTEGWVAVGFDPSSMMKDANIIIGYIKNGSAVIEDHYGSGRTKHRSDIDLGGSSNLASTGGREANGNTTIEFSIPLNSGDSTDRVLVPGKTYRVIFAYGRKDDLSSYHKARTGADITL